MTSNRIGLGQGIVAAAAFCLAVSATSIAQTTTPPTTTTPTTMTDLNQLIEQFGGFFGLDGTGGTGITTTPTTTDTETPTPPPDSGEGTGPQPTIVSNQFTTTSGGALNERRPGLMIQRSFAIQNGSVMPEGNYVDEPNFAQSVFNEIGLNMIETISSLIESLNLLGSVGDIFNPGGGTGGTGFPGAATSGGGTTTPIS